MSSIEHALLTKIIDDRDFHTIERAQITDEFFSTPESKELFKYLSEVYHNPISIGQVPSREMVRYRFPSFYPFASQDSVAVLAQQLRQEKIKTESLLLAQEIAEIAERNPYEALALLRNKSSSISALSEAGEDLSLASSYQMLLRQYERVQDNGGILGIPYPLEWGPLNEETQGMQGGQFIVLFGRPKSMKTWIATWLAVWAYKNCRKRVLYYTREMTPKLMMQRIAASVARVDYKAFKNGKLQPELKARTFAILQELMQDETTVGAMNGHQPYLKVISDKSASHGGGGGGVGWLQSKIRDFQPDIVFVDGMYLMKDDRTKSRSVDWKNITHISQDLKITAQDFDIPVVGITQANRAADKSKGEDLTELSYADALGQDADAVFRVSRVVKVDENTKQKTTELVLKAPGLREGEFDGIVLEAKPAIDFRFLRALTSQGEDEEEGGNGYKQSARPTFRKTFAEPRFGAVKKPGE